MIKLKRAAPIIFLTILFGFIFFYRIDYNTLESFDEAWYASIAREMAKTGDFMNMIWNGKPYFDHPPMGFWLMAISYKLFGVNEFATRFPSALLGLLSILLVYKTANELFGKKTIGFVTVLILGTSVWYVIRARSGNLESVFVFFYILTLFLSLKSAKNFSWFPLAMLSFGALILSKTLVGVSAIILITYLNFQQIVNFKKNWLLVFFGLWLFILTIFPWYNFHIEKYPGFIDYHFIHKGTRDKNIFSYLQPKLDLPLFYLHMGVRKWYYLWLASLGFLLITFKFIKKNIFFLLLWNFIVLYPFLTSKETELWHLIPVYLPLSFIVAVGVYEGIQLLKSIFKVKSRLFEFLYLIFFLYISFLQIKIFYKEVFPQSKYITDQVDIARRVTKYKKRIFLDIDYLPVAVFYSDRKIDTLVYEASGEATFKRLFEIDNGNVVGITKNWVIEDLEKKNFPLRVLEQNNTYSIVTKP